MKNLQKEMIGLMVTIIWKGVTITVIISTGLLIALVILWRLIN